MRNRKINRFISVLLVFVINAVMLLPILALAADNTHFDIKNTDDFEVFISKCKKDAWSRGKTIYLTTDLDLSYKEYKPIPTFGGYFNGNGHTVTGVKIDSNGSELGLFRYVQSSGTVENLNVKGEVKPDGSKKKIGGIAGECSGIIKNCSFEGDVKADANVGGICGYLTESGRILNSRFNGNVTGESYTGGICGQSYGLISKCVNNGKVNTTDTDETKTIQDAISNLDLNIKNVELRSTEKIDTSTDTGGICGFSKGKIEDCINYGNIGYKSVGYNTGGICGRQSGTIQACQNYGEINGRKDIGGILGQAEPYILLEYSKDALNDLDSVLDKIQNIIDNSETFSGNEVSDSFENINKTMGNLSGSAEVLSKTAEGYADEIAKQTNDLSGRIAKAMDDSADAIDGISDGGNTLSEGIRNISNAEDSINTVLDKLKSAADNSDDAAEHLKNASSYFEKAMYRISDSFEILEDNANQLESGLKELKKALNNLNDALKKKENIEQNAANTAQVIEKLRNSTTNVSDALYDVSKTLKNLDGKGYDIGGLKEFIKKFEDAAESFKNIAAALGQVVDAFLIIAEGFDINGLGSAFRILAKGFDFLAKGFASLKNAVKEFEKGADELDGISDDIKNVNSELKAAFDVIGEGGDKISDSIGKFSDIVNEFNNSGTFKLPSASEMFDDDISKFFDELNNTREEFTKLTDVLKSKKTSLSNDISDLNDQLKAVSDILSDTYDKQMEKREDGVIEDISDKDYSGDLRGKIELSHNEGKVYGDVSVGGIVGSMAIEYDFDPEDDIKSENTKSLEFTYKSKCVLRRCANYGDVSVKKNYIGGIVGRMDLGSIISAENYGNVHADDGDYVGGIAGNSETVIRNSVSKCDVSGNRYVGGICGKASEISGCYAIANASSYDENAGVIAGDADISKLRNNYFVNDFLGGVDDITYVGAAEQTEVSSFVNFVKGHFGTDIKFNLRFVVDDKEIARIPFVYKEAIPEDVIPKVPKKSGYYGKWSYYNYSEPMFDAVINAEYYRDIELLSSEIKRGDKPIVLICGAFDDNAGVMAAENEKDTDKPRKIKDSYYVVINGSYTEKYIVRYLPKSDKGCDIYIQGEDGLKKISTKKLGSYLEFETQNNKFTIYETARSLTSVIIIILVILLVTVASAVIIIRKRKK